MNVFTQALDGMRIVSDAINVAEDIQSGHKPDLQTTVTDIVTIAGRDFKLKTPGRLTSERLAKLTADLEEFTVDLEECFEPI